MVDSNKLRHDVQNEVTLIRAKFGKDLFNISKVIVFKTKRHRLFAYPYVQSASVLDRLCKWLMQGMNDIDLSSFTYGGMNVTGFQIVDSDNQTVRNFLSEWEKLDAIIFHGAGSRKISVSTYTLCFITMIFVCVH